jgi:hypothetical protein
MKLENHLIYFDITQICGIGCEFCMYSDKHTIKEHLVLTQKAKENISKLINHKEIKQVSISGEGEPLNNIKALKEILQLSQGGISFEFITSGYISHDKLFSLYKDIDEIVSKNGDSCNIRLSTDSYHIPKIMHKPHSISIKYLLENHFKNITFSFRSIDIDKIFTRDYLQEELKSLGIDSKIIIKDELEDILIVDTKEFHIDYKNLVKPTFLKDTKYMTLREYINEKEKKSNNTFTLGNVNKKPLEKGMGITIKPNGDIYFYGIDCTKLANIHQDNIDIDYFKEFIQNDKLIYTLYTIPFMKLMNKISINNEIIKLIEETNNPYWIIKELINYDKSLLEKLIDND